MITVLITVYNGEEFIADAINSILVQDYSDYEILIIDDGSTDCTREIIEAFNDRRINYIRIEHIGRSEALNFGLKNCLYDWVMLHDADDIILPGKLKKFSQFTDYPENTIVSSNALFFDERGKILCKWSYPTENLAIRKLLLLHGFNNQCLLNSKFVLSLGGYCEAFNGVEDYEFFLRNVQILNILILPEISDLKRLRKNSISRKNKNKSLESLYSIQSRYYSKNKLFSDLSEIEKSQILLWREYFFGNTKNFRSMIINISNLRIITLKLLLAFFYSFFRETIENIFPNQNLRFLVNRIKKRVFRLYNNEQKYLNIIRSMTRNKNMNEKNSIYNNYN